MNACACALVLLTTFLASCTSVWGQQRTYSFAPSQARYRFNEPARNAVKSAAKVASKPVKAVANAVEVLFVHAPWCGPCRRMEPYMPTIPYSVTDVNGDAQPGMVSGLQVTSYPTVIVRRGGRELGRHVGYTSREGLVGWIESVLDRRQNGKIQGGETVPTIQPAQVPQYQYYYPPTSGYAYPPSGHVYLGRQLVGVRVGGS